MLAEVRAVSKLAKLHYVYQQELNGLGDAVADVLMGKVNCAFKKIGVQDQFGQSGKAKDVLKEYGLTAPQIAEAIKATF